MKDLEIVREKVQNHYRVIKNDEDLEWNRAIDLCTNIINAHLSRGNTPEFTRSSRDNEGWIPVDERLPEELAPVLVTACVPVRKPGWDKRKECCVVVDTDVYDPEIKHGWEYFKDKVTAWMPLPEPYQREEAINEKE